MKKKQFRIASKTVWDACRAFPEGHHREALVLLFFETGPITNWTGLYSAPPVDIAEHTRLAIEEVRNAIGNLERRGLIVYDHDRQLVYVKGLLLRQMRSCPNKDQARGIERHVEEFSENSPAVLAFISEHRETPELAKLFAQRGEGSPTPLPDTTPREEVISNKQKGKSKNTVPSERTALRAGESDKPSLEATPAAIGAVEGRRPQRPNVIFMKTPRINE